MELGEIRDNPEKAKKYINSLVETAEKMASRIEHLQEELRLALLRKFGRSSEKTSPDQLELFEEAEDLG